MKSLQKLEEIKAMVYACTQCGFCREKYSDDVYTRLPSFRVCPVREHAGGFEHHYARGKIQIAQGILEGKFPYSEDLVELLYADPDCRLCTWVCDAERVLDPPKVWRAMRQDIVAAGLGPPVRLKEIDSRVMRWHNRFGARPDHRSRWTEKEFKLPQKGDLLYFAGCFASYSRPEIARSTAAILREAGLGLAYLGQDEWCCGVVQFHDGSTSLARQMAAHNIEAIRASGAKRVVTSCAECYKSLKVEYPQMFGDVPFEVVHISELLAELADSGRVSFRKGLGESRITFHDPCHLGRYCGVYDQPRQVLRSIPGVELSEMLRHREYAWCCGNGADLVRSVAPELASEIARDRVEEARDAGAQAIVSACPRCESNLNRGAEGIKVYDLTLAVAKAMDIDVAVVPCRHQCPAGIDIPRYVRFIREGKFAEALAVIREKVPFPGVLGRVCFHPCEGACRRCELDESIDIRTLKRFASEHDSGLWRANSKVAPATGKRVAIIGSGPAGLTAAYYLAKQGHSVTVFEALPQPGGMTQVGIPEYRLPRNIIDAEIAEIRRVGVDIRTNTRVESLDDLSKQGFNAVFLALGAHQGIKMDIRGEDSPGVMECIRFLRDVNLGKKISLQGKVAVIGGGNAAVDSARTALRLGSSEVTIIYRRSSAEMPAMPDEIEAAIDEGVNIVFLAAPNKITRENGTLRVECIRMELGEPDASGRPQPIPIKDSEFTMNFDTVIAAIGQMPDIPGQFGLRTGNGNRLQVDPNTLVTSKEGIFAGGDVVSGPASVIEAIAAGRQAAIFIDQYLGGDGLIDETLAPPEEAAVKVEKVKDDKWRSHLPTLPVAARLQSFTEVELGITGAMAIEEAKRCLRCDLELRG